MDTIQARLRRVIEVESQLSARSGGTFMLRVRQFPIKLRCQPRSTPTPKWRSFHTSRRCFEEFHLPQPPPGGLKSFAEAVGRPGILRPTLFALGVSGVGFLVSAKLTNLDTEYWMKKLAGPSTWQWNSSTGTTSGEMKRARLLTFVEAVKRQLEDIKRVTLGFPNTLRYGIVHSYASGLQTWVNTREGVQLCLKIAALNTMIWFAWQIPRFEPFMARYFVHNPLSGLSVGLLTSVFSHKSFVHLLFNMIALTSFGHTAFLWMEREQANSESRLQESTAQYHFLAFFVAGGLVSGLVSHIASARLKFPKALAELAANAKSKEVVAAQSLGLSGKQVMQTPAIRNRILPSLGASGAVYSAITVTAIAFPDTEVSLIFPPTPSFPIQYGVGGLICLDILGVLRGWRTFDHFAHLGGAAFGALYWRYGPHFWDKSRVAMQ